MKYFCHSNSCIRCSRSIAGRAGQVGSLSGCLLQILGYVSTSTPSPGIPRRAACVRASSTPLSGSYGGSPLRWSRASRKGVTTPGRFEQPTVVHAILPGYGDPQDASISCRVLASASFLHQSSSVSDPSCSLFLSHFLLLVAYFISPHLVL